MEISNGRFSCLAALVTIGLLQGEARGAMVAVLDVKAVGISDAKSVEGLSALVASEAARSPVRVLAGADLANLIGFERQKALLGCTESSCLAQIGGALGVDYLLTTEVSQVGGRWLMTTALLDVARARALGRVTKKAGSAGELVDLVAASVAETLAFLPPSRSGNTEAMVAHRQSPPAPTQRIAGYALLGVGGAALVGGVIAGSLAYAQHSDAKDHPAATDAALADTKASIERKLWAADGLFIAAAVAAGTGLVLALTAPARDPAAPATTVSFAPIAGGGAVAISGGF